MTNSSRTWILLVAALVATIGTSACGGDFRFADLWLTTDQQGRRNFERGDYQIAAERFEDPLWRGIAFYAAEDFESAAGQFSLLDSAEGWFNRGNALAHLERYPEAVAVYEQALERRPEYPEAEANRDYVGLFIAWGHATRTPAAPDTGGPSGPADL